MEFKAFQGFSRPNMTILKDHQEHEVGSQDKNLDNFRLKNNSPYDFYLHSALHEK